MEFKQPSIEEMLEAGVHFGHQSRRWNPVMSKFIYEKDNGSHVIDIYKTAECIRNATEFLYEVSKRGRQIVFVGTKRQARSVISSIAKETNSLFVIERWLGGTFTNFGSIVRNIKELDKLITDRNEGKFSKYTKKERLLLDRKIAKLERFYGGLRGLSTNPGAIVIVDVKKEVTAVREAKALKVPVVGIVDTNSDPTNIDVVIPANDDAIKSISLILGKLAEGIKAGIKEAPKVEPKSIEEPKSITENTRPMFDRKPWQPRPFKPGARPVNKQVSSQSNNASQKSVVSTQVKEVKTEVKSEPKKEVKSKKTVK